MGVVGLAGVLAACGGDQDSASTAEPEPDPAPPETTDAEPSQQDTPEEEATEEEAPDGETAALTTTGEVPVGGGVILNGPGVVVTQPAQGEFAAFSTTCTHQGCAVTEVADGLITCPCHGSQYSAADGSVQRGPAQQPLAEVTIVVDGDQILPS